MTIDEQRLASVSAGHPSNFGKYLCNRRQFLLGAVAFGLTPVVAGCTQGRQNTVDPLYQLLASAQSDVAAASSLRSSSAHVNDVITVRKAHIAALQAEISRQEKLWEKPATPSSSAPHTVGSLKKLRRHLTDASQEALSVVASNAGYRAGLAGSIAASCNALAKVVLS